MPLVRIDVPADRPDDCAALAEGLHAAVGLRREDLVVSLAEVQREDWSFGNGDAQIARP